MPATLFLSIMLLFNIFITGYKNTPPEPKGCAIIISVPYVDNKQLRESKLLPDTSLFLPLPATIKDNEKIYSILKKEGFKDENIIRLGTKETDKVTIKDIANAFTAIAGKIANNDLFVFYYSGHGYQIPNIQLNDKEKDGKDEVLVGWDGYFLDDNINAIYQKSFSKTRNIMLIDACNAETLWEILYKKNNTGKSSTEVSAISPKWNCRIRTDTYTDENFNALYYGASKDGKEAWGTNDGGYFTRALHSFYNIYWKNIKPDDLACKISIKMNALGDPNNGEMQYSELGTLSPEFKKSYLFKIKN